MDGEVVIDPAEINQNIVELYQNLFAELGIHGPLLDDLHLSFIDVEDAIGLDDQLTKEEMFGAISFMCGDKAPGPDGFSIAFFQSC